MSYELLYKIVIIGDSSTGKTNFLSKYITNEEFTHRLPTLGIDFNAKLIKSPFNNNIKVHFWDTSGSKKFINITRSYYTCVAGAIIMFDTSNLSSFENLPKWLNDFNMSNKYNDIPILIIGTIYNKKRVVPYDKVRQFAEKNKVFYDELDFNDKRTINQKPYDIMQPIWEDIWLKFVLEDKPCMGVRKYENYINYKPPQQYKPDEINKNKTFGNKFKNIKTNIGLHVQDMTEGCTIS